jgi:hypothetical protein
MHAITVSGDNDDTTSNLDAVEIKIFPKFISQIFYFYSNTRQFGAGPAHQNGKPHKSIDNGKTHNVIKTVNTQRQK